MYRIFIYRLMIILAYLFSVSPSNATVNKADFDHSHQNWTSLLQKQIKISHYTSTVNYKSIKKDPSELNAYLDSIKAVTQEQFKNFSDNDKLAFLINAYNAFTIKLIIDNYPVKSIKDLGSLFSSPWKKKLFYLFGKVKSLDDIEHETIRKSFNEPRIHFALVCASKGCPALSNEAYSGNRINQQLDTAAKNFLQDSSRNRFLSHSKTLEISPIFKWYADDFVKQYGSIENFIAELITSNPEDQKIIRDKKSKLSFLEYDWSLNDSL